MPQTSPSSSTSPLTEASVESLDLLMGKYPSDTTDDDERRIIAALHAQRKSWAELEASGQTRGPKKPKVAVGSIDIKDIQLDF